MPWKETKPMNERKQMILDWKSGEFTITDLAVLYHVSRKTIYKWIKRYQSEHQFAEASRAPHTVWNRTADEQIAQIIVLKKAHMNWGPKKIIAYLNDHHLQTHWPCPNTAGNWLKRNGLVKKRKRISRVPPYALPFEKCSAPNKVWSADFKGQFRTGDKKYCYPLTISDNYSRYLLQCRGLLHPCFTDCRLWFEQGFREYGLPDAIRTDNGTPFASHGITGISRLSKWWIQLGIIPERIGKGKPQENGRHERMHRTLKADTTHPVEQNIARQQKRFDVFVDEYNDERPHEALGQKPPAHFYACSEKRFPERLPEPQYDTMMKIRKVKHHGEISFEATVFFVSEVFAGEYLGLEEIDNGCWRVYYYHYPLGIINFSQKRLIRENKKV